MIVIGIIGAPAGGKSTVARRLRELGATWIHADQLAKRCLDWPSVIERLTTGLGRDLLNQHGQLDRRRLADRVFGDDDASRLGLEYLESVVHPFARHLVLRRLQRATLCGCRAATLDAPLLLEADWGVLCDAIWCVDAPLELRRAWLRSRGWSTAELQRRESRQLEISEKRRLATHVFENTGSLEQLTRKVDQGWATLVAQSQAPADPRLHGPPRHCTQYPLTLPSQLPSPQGPSPGT